MTQTVVSTLTLVESGEKEDAANEAITDLAFAPAAPITAAPPKWEVGATYAKNALVVEGTQIYRSQEAANKGNEPKADTDFAHWAPVGTSFVPLQNPSFGFPATAMVGHARLTPPASSAASASATETIGAESSVPLGV